jgi:hypothetical protein
MALRDWLNLASSVSVIRTISTNDGMGGYTSTSSTTILSLCAIWQNGSSNKYAADKYAQESSHTLALEYGTYNFGAADPSGGSVIETVSYNGQTYKIVGFQNNYLELNEIVTIQLSRTS